MLNADVQSWLDSLGLEQYAELFDEEAITMEVLVDLDDDDLKSLAVPLGHRKRLLRAIAALRHSTPAAEADRLERRQLTVLFSDLVGSTALSTQLDAEELRDILRSYQEICRETIEARGGIVARYQGDGVLAYFGYPYADEDSVVNAVRSGLEIVERVGERFQRRHETRVGVATGTVVVGDIIGEGHSRESPVVGETPNLAARLQSFAEPNQVVISNASRELVQAYLECEDLGQHELRGFSAAERIWRATGDRRVSSRFAAQVGYRGLRPLMGRSGELARIRDLWAEVADGRRRFLQLVGEAGSGKSRLLRAALDEVVSGPSWVAQCQPDRMSTALYPFASLLRDQVLELDAGADAASAYQRIDALLDARKLLSDEHRALLGGALSLPPPPDQAPLGSSPERQREASLELLRAVLTAVQPGEAGCLVIEDAHWLDPTSRELVEQLCADDTGPPVLTLFTSRVGLEIPDLPQQRLAGVSADAAAEICRNISARYELPDALVAQIIEKTDGNPLFIEEMTRTVLRALESDDGDRETLLSRLAVPMSLQDSLAARLDSIDLDLRDLLQLGAVIGRDFSTDLLRAVTGSGSPRVDRQLDELVRREFLVAKGEATFSFHHALVQDAAYAGLVRSRRRELHAQVATTLETEFPAVAASEPETLARHYTAAEQAQAAIPYWQAAGEAAGHRSASQEAVSHLRQCLELLAQTPESPTRDMKELAAQVAIGPSLMAVHGYTSGPVQAAYARARDLCEQFGDAPETIPVLFGLWIHYGAQGALQTSYDLAVQLNRVAAATQDPGLMLATNLSLGCSLYHMGRFEQSREHQDHVLQAYDPARDGGQCYVYGQDPYASSCVYSASLQWCLGLVDRGLELAERGVAVARDLDHPYTQALALVFAARFNTKLRDFAAVVSLSEEAIAIAREHGFPTWEAFATILLGHALARTQQSPEHGVAMMEEAMALSRESGQGLSLAWFESLLAGVLLQAADHDGAGQALARARAEINRFGEQAEGCEVERLEAQLALARGSESDAIAHFKAGVILARAQRATSWELRLLSDWERAAGGQGAALADCLSRIECAGATADVDEARALLAP